VVLTLDFEKAFDTIEHNTVFSMLQALGFPEKWISWTKEILTSASSAVLLNGVPGKAFQCKRGVRQGDPLSPLLFVLVAEILLQVLNKAATLNLLHYPLNLTHMSDFPVAQYADETILIMEASQRQLFYLKGILHTISLSTGLKVNFSKSCLLPINISEDKAAQIAEVFGCQVGTYPFTYLGMPMGTTKPRVEDFAPLVSTIERRISATLTWLSMAGRSTWVDSVVSSVPIYILCIIKLYATNIKSISKARRHGLWRDSVVIGKGKPSSPGQGNHTQRQGRFRA
jgi:hypothetical protein